MLKLFSPQALAPDPSALDPAVGLIASARRPIVVAGRGAVGARASLLRLAQRIGAPAMTTLKGRAAEQVFALQRRP